MNVTLDQVDRALARLWDEQAQRGVVTHQRTVNLVAVCTVPAALPIAHGVLAALLPVHPGRALVVSMYPGGEAALDTRVSLVADTRRGGEPCSEQITLDARGAARDWLPTAVERLLSPGARVYLWWLGDIPDDDTLYDRLTETADVVLVNTGDMDLRDLVTLDGLMEWARGSYAMADLNWVRLRPWQELLAGFFDDGAVCPALARASALTLSFVPHGPEPASTQAMLFAGWFAERVGARAEGHAWGADEVRARRADGGTLALRFRPVEREGVAPGALTRVELACDDGAHFEVTRDEDDPRVLGWQGECAGARIPPTVYRFGEADDAALLARQLEAPLRDALFESSLGTAAALLAPLYPEKLRAAPGAAR